MSFFFWSSLSLKWTHCRRLASRFSPKSISNDNRVDGFYPRKTTWPNWAKVSFLFYIIIPFSFFGKSGGNRFTAAMQCAPHAPTVDYNGRNAFLWTTRLQWRRSDARQGNGKGNCCFVMGCKTAKCMAYNASNLLIGIPTTSPWKDSVL